MRKKSSPFMGGKPKVSIAKSFDFYKEDFESKELEKVYEDGQGEMETDSNNILDNF